MSSILPSRLRAIVATFFCLTAIQASADVWSDFTFSPVDNEFTRFGYSDPSHSSPEKRIYWAAFALQGGFIDSNPEDVYKNGDVYGDIGVADNGNIKLEQGFRLHKGIAGRGGDLYYHTPGQFTNNGAIIDGLVHNDANADSILDKGAAYALYATEYAFSQPSTYPGITNVALKNQNMLVQLTQQRNVLQLQNFTMQGGTFTLQGTAAQSIIINVNSNFLMNGGAQIVLQGGLEWDNVLFNVHGKGNVVSFDQSAYFRGILLAPKRHVRIKGASTIFGNAIGEKIELASLSKIIHPSVASP